MSIPAASAPMAIPIGRPSPKPMSSTSTSTSSFSPSSSASSGRCGIASCTVLSHRVVSKWEEPIAHMCFPPIGQQQIAPVVAGSFICDTHYEMMTSYQRDVERHMAEMATGHAFSPNEHHHTPHTPSRTRTRTRTHSHQSQQHDDDIDDTTPLMSNTSTPIKSTATAYSTFDEYPAAVVSPVMGSSLSSSSSSCGMPSTSSPPSTSASCDPSASFCSRLLYCHSQQAQTACTSATKGSCPIKAAAAQKQVSIEIPQGSSVLSGRGFPVASLSCLTSACSRERAACAAMNMGYAIVIVFFTLLILLSITGITKRFV